MLDIYFDPIKFKVIVPRLEDRIFTRFYVERPRTPWSFEISLFKDWVFDSDEKLNECFAFDWNCMKFPKMSEEDMIDMREAFMENYKTM